MAQPRLILRLLPFILLTIAASAAAATPPSQTSVVSDLSVDESVDGDVVVFGADLELGPNAKVSGDAIAVGGEVRMAPGARVGRHVVAVFGTATVPSNTQVGGRVLAFASLAAFRADKAAEHPLKVDFAMRILASGGWLLVATALAYLFPSRLRCATWAIPALGFKVPAIGLLAVLAIIASVVGALGLGPALGVPLVAGFMVVFFAAKVVGMTVLGCFIGGVVLRRWLRHPTPISLDAFVGILILLALRFLPAIGEPLWNVISLVAFGASIAVISVSNDMMRPETTRS